MRVFRNGHKLEKGRGAQFRRLMGMQTSQSYPAHLEADVVLRDGSTVHVRPVRPDDRDALRDFLDGLSMDSRWLRFFGGANIARQADAAADVDYRDRYGVVAIGGPDSRIVAHAEYVALDEERAEVAFEIADPIQGRGLGTILLAHLATAAEQNGIRTFEAEVLPQNYRMLAVFRESGFPADVHAMPDAITVELPTSITEEGLQAFDQRDQIAATAAVATFLRPSSVAVVGASRRRGSVGAEIFHNLLEAGFNGPVYPVNPTAAVVQSVPAYPTVKDIPGPVDLGVIVVPGEHVLGVARECGEKGARALVVISAGFSEMGGEGLLREAELLRICREFGMRLVGPNCLGVINTDPEISLNATFAPGFPEAGRVGFMSQSGALGLALIDNAAARGLGLSSFVSVGDKADISGNDLIQYWEGDEKTDLILVYLESFGNPRRFARIARRVARTKPIVAVKSGHSKAGARATSSHTGALIAASDVNVDALFQQSGVVRTSTLGELLDVASLLANQPYPKGNRVAILTNSGGPGIMCADACEGAGLDVVDLSEGTVERLRALLADEASLTNPVDMLATASGDQYRDSMLTVAHDERVDAMILIFTPTIVTQPDEIGRAIAEAAGRLPRAIPVMASFISSTGAPGELQSGSTHVPAFDYPEQAAQALGRAVTYGAWQARDPGEVPQFDDARSDEAAAVIAGALARGPGWLRPSEVERVLDCYGLDMAESRLVRSPSAAGKAAQEMGGDVVVKAISPTLVHKTEAGAVRVGLSGRAATARAAHEMEESVASFGHRVEGFLVQRQVPDGVEMLVGVVNDPLFGPVVACGAGGITAELLKDVQVRLTPLTDRDAAEMVRGLRTFPLLEGYRGAPGADLASLEELVLRVSTLVEAHPELVEMDCNPVMATPEGAVIVDARIRVQPAPPPRPWAGVRTRPGVDGGAG
jgi:acetate---CoA ligase (ADP-forming)